MTSAGSKAMADVGLGDHNDGGTRGEGRGEWSGSVGSRFFSAPHPQCKNDGAVGDRAARAGAFMEHSGRSGVKLGLK